ncbi:MAG TPA: EAL domain-containing protein [Frankiaceae bacterium]|nr:EAL domain-containing protein [Frankiaceae bacterium]
MDLAKLLADPAAFGAKYQPIVALASGRPVAYEALLHVEGVPPGAVFGAAATAGRLADLDRVARDVAVRDAAGWLGGALLFVKLAVAPGDLPPDWLASTRAVAAEAAVPLRQVVLEVVQPGPGETLERTARIVTRCRGAGCQVALVGALDPRTVRNLVSALLPDYVTLDRSVVARLPGAEATETAEDVVRAAEAGAARVIAFGVENDAQAAAVGRLGVEWAQGYLYGRPERRSPTVDTD